MEQASYKKIKRYSSIKNRFYLANLAYGIIMLAVFLFSGLTFKLKELTFVYFNNFYFRLALYYTVFSLGFYLLSLPLDYYNSFVIEHKFKLSAHTNKSWFKDNIKKGIASFVLALLMIEVLYYFLKNFSAAWWIYAGIAFFFVSIVLSKILPVVILPLFYKQKPLDDERLKERLFKLADKAGKKIKNIYSINLSKETKKANAALVGSGKTRRILLADTLLNRYTNDEIEVIVAHELGHHKLKHMFKLLIAGGVISLISFYIIDVGLKKLIAFFGIDYIYDIAGLPLIILIFMFFSLIVSPLQNAYTRYLENQADTYALRKTGLFKAFISAMNKLTRQNMSDPAPSKFIEIMLYDHPPVSKRIKTARKMKKITTANKLKI
jgi:STE24 endopeptidase